MLNLRVEHEDTDDQQRRTVVVALRLRGGKQVPALAGVLHAATCEVAETSS